MAKRKTILQALKRMRDYYGKEPRQAVIDAYVRVLESRPEITDEEVERAADTWIAREDWFPDRVSKFMRVLESGAGEAMSPIEMYWAGMRAFNDVLAGRRYDQKMLKWIERKMEIVDIDTSNGKIESRWTEDLLPDSEGLQTGELNYA